VTGEQKSKNSNRKADVSEETSLDTADYVALWYEVMRDAQLHRRLHVFWTIVWWLMQGLSLWPTS